MKVAGRLGTAVTASLDKVGRAFAKPFFAQAYDPRKWVTPQLHSFKLVDQVLDSQATCVIRYKRDETYDQDVG